MDECDTIAEEGAHMPVTGYAMHTTFLQYGIVCCNQIMDLENRNAALQEELSLSPAKRAALQTDWVPRAPASYTLQGHRAQVTKVAFHPTFNLIASASEDTTVKIWDWETGEFERTLKGHTRGVNDVAFDSKGNLLGACAIVSRTRVFLDVELTISNSKVTCSADIYIKVWDVQNDWRNTKTFPGHEHTVSCVRFMPGDQQIISASRDRSIRIFDIASTFVSPFSRAVLFLNQLRTDILFGQSTLIPTGYAG